MVTSNEPPSGRHNTGTGNRFGVPGGVAPTLWHVTSPPAVPGNLSPDLASKLLEAYTQPGDLAIDVDDDKAFAAAAIATGRHHRSLRGATRLAGLSQQAGTADLLVMRWPRPHTNPRWLLVTCRLLLRTDGRLAIALTVPARQRAPHLTALIGAAHTAGMRHLAHIVVLATAPGIPETDQEPRQDNMTDDASLAPDVAQGQRPVLSDFLIFNRPD